MEVLCELTDVPGVVLTTGWVVLRVFVARDIFYGVCCEGDELCRVVSFCAWS